MRKDTGLAVTDRIALQIWCTDDALSAALDAHRTYVADEVLAVRIDLSTGEPVSGAVVLEGLPVTVFVEKFLG
jgi:hypothetical protein